MKMHCLMQAGSGGFGLRQKTLNIRSASPHAESILLSGRADKATEHEFGYDSLHEIGMGFAAFYFGHIHGFGTVVAAQTDIASQYSWQPVRIGGGGWVVGMTVHPLDSTVRYARTDVGNAYRWSNSTNQWIPMRVSNTDGSGVLSASETDAPSSYGADSDVVDPANTSVVYMVFPTEHSTDISTPTNYVEIYKSVDGGLNFTPGNMSVAGIVGNPNGPNRMDGEKLAVDPGNTSVLYYGSDSQGLYRSLDDGMTWTQYPLSGSTGPPVNVEFVSIQFAKGPGTVKVNGVVVSKTVFAISINNNGDGGGDVYQSIDGGQSWTDISTSVTDSASGQSLSHQALSSSIDASDALYVVENSAVDEDFALTGSTRRESGRGFRCKGQINQAPTSVAVDPTNAQRIYVLAADTSMSRSDDGGSTWINLGSPQYANTLGWLPQTVGMNGGDWHSNGGLKVDAAGNLWSPTGQEGTITLSSAAASAATAASPPRWTILSTGIEELVTMDMTVPPGSKDTILAIAMDATGFYIPDPDNFTAVQIPLQQEGISQGTGVAYSPDVPSYVAVTTSNVYTNGPNYSGYSTNGGMTWTRFGPALQYACGAVKCDIPAGMIAVSIRGSRSLGSDHIVLYPPDDFAPQYSQDGGATWHVTASFPLNADGLTINTADYNSFAFPQLNQHLLRADPFTADKFYLKFTHAPSSLYISTDGGKTWAGQPDANLPDAAWSGQLVANEKVKNDLWYADGYAGSSLHGVFHSTDGGQTFQQLPEISHAIVIALGAGSGQAGDAAYTVYFYGLMTGSAQWGIFRSTNGGASWDRISYYPTGIYDVPRAMAASQDTFGKVYLGWSGNSFVYGQISGTGPVGPALPGAPTGLMAAAVSNTEIDLSWTPSSGTVSSYNIYRGTAQGGESATAVAAGITAAAYADKALSAGTQYWYEVTAINATGQGRARMKPAPLRPRLRSRSPRRWEVPHRRRWCGADGDLSTGADDGQLHGHDHVLMCRRSGGDQCTVPAPVSITAASSTTQVKISVHTASTSANVRGTPLTGLIAFAGGLLMVPLFFRRRRAAMLNVIFVACALFMGVGSCGGGNSGGKSTPPPVVSTLTVSAAATGLTAANQTLTLTVQ